MDRFKDQQKRVADNNNDKKNELLGVKHLASCDNLEVVLIKKVMASIFKNEFLFCLIVTSKPLNEEQFFFPAGTLFDSLAALIINKRFPCLAFTLSSIKFLVQFCHNCDSVGISPHGLSVRKFLVIS